MPIGGNYTVEEWDAIKERASLADIPDDQLMLLHRHWIWADHARLTFEEALRTEKWDHEDIKERTPWAMYTWYGLLYVLIEGATQRRMRFQGELLRDVRQIRDALREARNATFHVGSPDTYVDDRLLGIVQEDATAIYRAHQGIGQLLLDEMRERTRRRAGSTRSRTETRI
jgi:hypothetical protein